MATVAQLQAMVQKFSDFKNSIQNGRTSLLDVKRVGTILYTDATFAAAFPNSIVAYQAFLLSIGTAIDNFIASFPAEPPLNG